MQKFILRYKTDPEFREFLDATSTDDVLMDFVYELYMKYGKQCLNKTSAYINSNLLDINIVIEHYEKSGEFERCQKLAEIKKSMT